MGQDKSGKGGLKLLWQLCANQAQWVKLVFLYFSQRHREHREGIDSTLLNKDYNEPETAFSPWTLCLCEKIHILLFI